VARSPNILMVLADQHNASLMGCAGHAQALTPHLDDFAASGTRFTEAHCQNPICTPSRVSILSGQYCHNHGYYGLSGPSNAGLDNLFRHARSHGYRTAGFGKLHLPTSPANWIAEDVDVFGDAYETADGVVGDSDFLRHLEKAGLRHLEDSWHNAHHYGSGTISHDARPSELPYEHTLEHWCADRAIEFMDADREQPFCIQVAFQKPHHPLLPQQRFWDLYDEDLELPPTIDHPPDGRPPHFQQMWHNFHDRKWDYDDDFGGGTRGGMRRAWRGTLACISQIDDVFGRLLAHLDASGLAQDTIVIYGSDHGAYHGIHGIEEKAPGICSDAVCRVPMIWRVPGRTAPGAVCEQLVENIDMLPTLSALCGMSDFAAADGHDLSRLLDGEDTPVRESAVTENVLSKALRWDRWRLVHYDRQLFGGEDVGELYDMAADPDECRNLYHDPEHSDVVHEGRRRLMEWLARTTRVVTAQPTVGDHPARGEAGRRTHPVCTDGRAPNHAQPRHHDYGINYL
jgi:arylsulfatase